MAGGANFIMIIRIQQSAVHKPMHKLECHEGKQLVDE